MTDQKTSLRPNGPPSFPQNSGHSARIIFVLMLWFFFTMTFALRAPKREEVAYSYFLDQVESGQVATVSMGTERIDYTLKPLPDLNPVEKDAVAKMLTTVPLPADAALPGLLRSHNIEITATANNSWGWLGFFGPLILCFFLFNLLSSQAQGGPAVLGVGKSKARMYLSGTADITFDDVAGVDEVKTELKEIVDFLQDAEKCQRIGAKIPKGVLLVGPPGTGKTLLARAIAGETGVPFFSISASEFIEMFVGVGASRVRDLFVQAKRQAPCIVFIDELDALGKARSAKNPMNGSSDERDQTLNQLLAEMDGFEPNAGVILLAATNRPEVLDQALLRAGRFDRQIVVDRPDRKGREAILAVHARGVHLASDVALESIAARTPGFAGADLANLVNEAALLAARNNQTVVKMVDFNEAIERIMTGLEKKSRVLNELEKRTVAYHEAGHAIIGAVMPGGGAVEKISIVPRGVAALGYTLQLPEDDRFLMMEDEIRGRLATLLGGRAAEELIFKKVSTGASDDIQKATELAERCITLYGMSKILGPVAVDRAQSQFLEGYPSPRRPISPRLTEAIDDEIKSLMENAHEMALEILIRNRSVLECIARTLLERESLEGEALKTLLADIQAPTNLSGWLNQNHFDENRFDSRQLRVYPVKKEKQHENFA
ncbi:MAG: ATP-dependent zinc metalloprotease FtsH [Cyanobacteria bacterium J06649_4]